MAKQYCTDVRKSLTVDCYSSMQWNTFCPTKNIVLKTRSLSLSQYIQAADYTVLKVQCTLKTWYISKITPHHFLVECPKFQVAICKVFLTSYVGFSLILTYIQTAFSFLEVPLCFLSLVCCPALIARDCCYYLTPVSVVLVYRFFLGGENTLLGRRGRKMKVQ